MPFIAFWFYIDYITQMICTRMIKNSIKSQCYYSLEFYSALESVWDALGGWVPMESKQWSTPPSSYCVRSSHSFASLPWPQIEGRGGLNLITSSKSTSREGGAACYHLRLLFLTGHKQRASILMLTISTRPIWALGWISSDIIDLLAPGLNRGWWR